MSAVASVHAQNTEATLDIQKCPGPSTIGGDIWITPRRHLSEMYVTNGSRVLVYDVGNSQILLRTSIDLSEQIVQVRTVRAGDRTQVVYITTPSSLQRFYLGGENETEWIRYGAFYDLGAPFVIESMKDRGAMIIAHGRDLYIEGYPADPNQNLPRSNELWGHLGVEYPFGLTHWDDVAMGRDLTLYALSQLTGVWKYKLTETYSGTDHTFSATSIGAMNLFDQIAWSIRGYPEEYLLALDGGTNRHSSQGSLMIGPSDNPIRAFTGGIDAMLIENGALVSTYLDGIVFVRFSGNFENEEYRLLLPNGGKTWAMARDRWDIYVMTYDYGVLLFSGGEKTLKPKQLCLRNEFTYRIFLPSLVRQNEGWMGNPSTPRPGESMTPRPAPTARRTPAGP